MKRSGRLFLAINLILTAAMLLASCKGDGEGTRSYAEGTELEVLVTDGRLTELSALFEAAEDELGITVSATDTSDGSFDVIVGAPSDLSRMSGGLLELTAHAESTERFSARLSGSAFLYLSSVGDTSGSIYIASRERSEATAVFSMRADWIRTLLDGEGEFSAESCGAITEYFYTPRCSIDGIETVEVYRNGVVETVDKEYAVGGNIVHAMNTEIIYGTLDGVKAVNMLRRYIDEVYSGYYGMARSELFLGDSAAWNADELVALLRCISANAYTLTGGDCVSGAVFAEGDGKSLLAFAGALFGARGLVGDDRLYVDASGTVKDARGESITYRALEAVNAMIDEGLVSLGDNMGAVSYGTPPNGGYVITLPPFASWDDGEISDTPLRFAERGSVLSERAVAISREVSEDENKLSAALAFLDYLYTDGVCDAFFGSDNINSPLTDEQCTRAELLGRLESLGIIRTDELSFTENPWYSAPFDNLDALLTDGYPELEDGSATWEDCYAGDPLLDIAINGYTRTTVSRDNMIFVYKTSCRIDLYESDLMDAMEALFGLYRNKK